MVRICARRCLRSMLVIRQRLLLVGDAGSAARQYRILRGDMVPLAAGVQTLISYDREPQNLFPLYHHNAERSLLWDVLGVIVCSGALQRPGWYRGNNADISRDLWDQGNTCSTAAPVALASFVVTVGIRLMSSP